MHLCVTLTWFSALLFSLPMLLLTSSIAQQLEREHWKKRKSSKSSVKKHPKKSTTETPGNFGGMSRCSPYWLPLLPFSLTMMVSHNPGKGTPRAWSGELSAALPAPAPCVPKLSPRRAERPCPAPRAVQGQPQREPPGLNGFQTTGASWRARAEPRARVVRTTALSLAVSVTDDLPPRLSERVNRLFIPVTGVPPCFSQPLFCLQ